MGVNTFAAGQSSRISKPLLDRHFLQVFFTLMEQQSFFCAVLSGAEFTDTRFSTEGFGNLFRPMFQTVQPLRIVKLLHMLVVIFLALETPTASLTLECVNVRMDQHVFVQAKALLKKGKVNPEVDQKDRQNEVGRQLDVQMDR